MAYTTKYQQKVDEGLKKLGEVKPFEFKAERPVYTDRYAEQADRLLRDVTQPKAFTYNPETDPNFQSYKKQYLREGQRATQDAIGTAAAANGGAVSTAGMTAATQAGGYYASKVADVVPTLYQQAYDKYLNEYSQKLQALGAVNEQEQLAYDKHRDEVGDFEDDRQFQYGVHGDEYGRLLDQIDANRSADNTAYERHLDELAMESSGGTENGGTVNALGFPAQYDDYLETARKAGGSGDKEGAMRILYSIDASGGVQDDETFRRMLYYAGVTEAEYGAYVQQMEGAAGGSPTPVMDPFAPTEQTFYNPKLVGNNAIRLTK